MSAAVLAHHLLPQILDADMQTPTTGRAVLHEVRRTHGGTSCCQTGHPFQRAYPTTTAEIVQLAVLVLRPSFVTPGRLRCLVRLRSINCRSDSVWPTHEKASRRRLYSLWQCTVWCSPMRSWPTPSPNAGNMEILHRLARIRECCNNQKPARRRAFCQGLSHAACHSIVWRQHNLYFFWRKP